MEQDRAKLIWDFETGDRFIDISVLQRIIRLPGEGVGVIGTLTEDLLGEPHRFGQ